MLLQRQEWKSEPKQRWPPAGKVWDNENLKEAMIRELQEETGIEDKEEKTLKKDFLFGKLHTTFVRYDNYDFEYHEFILDKFINDKKQPKVILNKNEHCWYKRILPHEALTLDLMPDEDWFVRRFFWIEL